MGIYSLNTDFITENLMPTALRTNKHLAWLKVLMKPLYVLFNVNFLEYKDGSISSIYDSGTTYTFGQRVIHTNKSTYELIVSSSLAVDPTNTTNWVKINDCFIGSNERASYNAQKMLFEYALNKFFLVDPYPADQIYITNRVYYGNPFLMSTSGAASSTMPINSTYSTTYLGSAYTFTTGVYDYTIYVPIAVFNNQGSNDANREQAIRNFADKYNLAGMIYLVETY
jgi:hypothetical protein